MKTLSRSSCRCKAMRAKYQPARPREKVNTLRANLFYFTQGCTRMGIDCIDCRIECFDQIYGALDQLCRLHCTERVADTKPLHEQTKRNSSGTSPEIPVNNLKYKPVSVRTGTWQAQTRRTMSRKCPTDNCPPKVNLCAVFQRERCQRL